MEITKLGNIPSVKGPDDWFTGSVCIDFLFDTTEAARASGASVTFEPGSRTAWHKHPLGQVLIITAGAGRVQRAGGPIETIRSGDVVRIEPNERHWHGAGEKTAMTHIAIQEAQDGQSAEWMEHVSDQDYLA